MITQVYYHKKSQVQGNSTFQTSSQLSSQDGNLVKFRQQKQNNDKASPFIKSNLNKLKQDNQQYSLPRQMLFKLSQSFEVKSQSSVSQQDSISLFQSETPKQLIQELNVLRNENKRLNNKIDKLQAQINMIKSNSKSPAVSKRSQQNMSMDIKDLKNLISLYFSKLGNRKSKFLAMTMLRAHLNQINLDE